MRHLAAAALLALALPGCGTFNDDDRFAYVEEPVEELYRDAARNLERNRYSDAIAGFEEVERQHPYTVWARRAMLMIAYTHYLQNDYEDSTMAIDRFLAVHPGNKDAPYAYYLRAMNYYERIRDVGRDQDVTTNARRNLEDVVRRYPDTEYARDARLKLDLTEDHLAGKEMDVGRWYLSRNEHIAAINRFQTVVTDYPTTSHVPEALHRQVEAYLELGIIPEAQRQAAILYYNYPDSEWYRDTFRLLDRRGIADTSRLADWGANGQSVTASRPALTPLPGAASADVAAPSAPAGPALPPPGDG